MSDETEKSGWNRILGPFYSKEYLEETGVTALGDLIEITTTEGHVIYPHAQFVRQSDDSLKRREDVLTMFNSILRPAIEDGTIDQYMAAEVMLYGGEERLSKASVIEQGEQQAEKVATELGRMLSRFRQ